MLTLYNTKFISFSANHANIILFMKRWTGFYVLRLMINFFFIIKRTLITNKCMIQEP